MADVMKVYANFHNHTTHSDGVYTPEELVAIAADEGYRALSITDHDTYTGNAEAEAACRAAGIAFMPGIEFSTRSKAMHHWFHMTAFHFDPEYPEMKEYLARLSAREAHQTEVLFRRGLEIGYLHDITWDEVLEYNAGITWLCNEHVFRTMKHKGMVTDLDYPEFFDTLFGKHRAEVPPLCDFMEVEELIPLVHRAGGIICVAHPSTQLHLIDDLAAIGLDGIEVWHSLLDADQRREALDAARRNDLFVSGGSDHEGLCGGAYLRYEHPEETEFWFPPLTLGTTAFFAEELLNNKKRSDRCAIFEALLANADIWKRVK